MNRMFTELRNLKLNKKETEEINYLFDMISAAKQQIIIRKALYHEDFSNITKTIKRL